MNNFFGSIVGIQNALLAPLAPFGRKLSQHGQGQQTQQDATFVDTVGNTQTNPVRCTAPLTASCNACQDMKGSLCAVADVGIFQRGLRYCCWLHCCGHSCGAEMNYHKSREPTTDMQRRTVLLFASLAEGAWQPQTPSAPHWMRAAAEDFQC